MIVTCPQCHYSREVASERLPAGSAYATCPRCGCRFQLVPEVSPAAPGGDVSGPEAGAPEGGLPSSSVPAPDSPPPSGRGGRPSSGDASSPTEKLPPSASLPREQSSSRSGGQELHDEPAFTGSPWDAAPGSISYPSAFYLTCMQVLLAPSSFFDRLNPGASQTRALLFYFILSVLQVLVERLWVNLFVGFLTPSASSDPGTFQLLEMLSSQSDIVSTLLLRTGFLLLELYIMSGIFSLLLRIIVPGQRPDFNLVVQVAAYASAPAVLCIIPILGSAAGVVWSLACTLIGFRVAFRLNWGQALGVVLPLYAFLFPFMIQLAAGLAAV